jgi:hypothetical protein
MSCSVRCTGMERSGIAEWVAQQQQILVSSSLSVCLAVFARALLARVSLSPARSGVLPRNAAKSGLCSAVLCCW